MRQLFFNKAIHILLLTDGIVMLAGAMLGPIYAIFVEEIGGGLLDASFAGGIFALAAGITTLISGRYSDKIKENELIIVLGYIIMGIGFALYLIVRSIEALFLIQIVIGFGEAIYGPAFDAVYSKHLERKKSGFQWGSWEAMSYFTTATGAILGGIIVTRFGFDAVFVIMSFLCFGSALYLYFLPRCVL